MAGSFRRVAALAAFVLAATPAFADNYLISGRWGVSTFVRTRPGRLRPTARHHVQRQSANRYRQRRADLPESHREAERHDRVQRR